MHHFMEYRRICDLTHLLSVDLLTNQQVSHTSSTLQGFISHIDDKFNIGLATRVF
ncbi:hypothetical protein PALB_17630 [Pseudoalteromonas luteoviolacea B = ATCC 29581]|nr:hypothetical protein PALB_17630 [Pseudoalteromonas luteoviolacea B = ATCC 29581]